MKKTLHWTILHLFWDSVWNNYRQTHRWLCHQCNRLGMQTRKFNCLYKKIKICKHLTGLIKKAFGPVQNCLNHQASLTARFRAHKQAEAFHCRVTSLHDCSAFSLRWDVLKAVVFRLTDCWQIYSKYLTKLLEK